MSKMDNVTMEKIEEIATELYDVEQGLICTIELIGKTDEAWIEGSDISKIKGLLECIRKALSDPVEKIFDIVNG